MGSLCSFCNKEEEDPAESLRKRRAAHFDSILPAIPSEQQQDSPIVRHSRNLNQHEERSQIYDAHSSIVSSKSSARIAADERVLSLPRMPEIVVPVPDVVSPEPIHPSVSLASRDKDATRERYT